MSLIISSGLLCQYSTSNQVLKEVVSRGQTLYLPRVWPREMYRHMAMYSH